MFGLVALVQPGPVRIIDLDAANTLAVVRYANGDF